MFRNVRDSGYTVHSTAALFRRKIRLQHKWDRFWWYPYCLTTRDSTVTCWFQFSSHLDKRDDSKTRTLMTSDALHGWSNFNTSLYGCMLATGCIDTVLTYRTCYLRNECSLFKWLVIVYFGIIFTGTRTANNKRVVHTHTPSRVLNNAFVKPYSVMFF